MAKLIGYELKEPNFNEWNQKLFKEIFDKLDIPYTVAVSKYNGLEAEYKSGARQGQLWWNSERSRLHNHFKPGLDKFLWNQCECEQNSIIGLA